MSGFKALERCSGRQAGGEPMRIEPGFMLVLVVVGGACIACDGGPTFAVNERIFELPSMKSAGGGCIAVRLGGGGRGATGTAGGSDGSTLAIEASFGGDEMVVKVTEGGRLVAERTYDEAFLRSGRLDQFTVTASTGHSRLLRYWASYDSDGQPRCAPLEADGPPLP
jgi:hypothetical protein